MFSEHLSDCNKIMRKSLIFLKIRKIALVSKKQTLIKKIIFPFISKVEETKISHSEVRTKNRVDRCYIIYFCEK